MKSFIDYGITIPQGRDKGFVKVICPNCRSHRKTHFDRSLSVNLNNGSWSCQFCDWHGSLSDD